MQTVIKRILGNDFLTLKALTCFGGYNRNEVFKDGKISSQSSEWKVPFGCGL